MNGHFARPCRWFGIGEEQERDDDVESQEQELLRLQKFFNAVTGMGESMLADTIKDQSVLLAAINGPEDVVVCEAAKRIASQPIKAGRGRQRTLAVGLCCSAQFGTRGSRLTAGNAFAPRPQLWEGEGKDFDTDLGCGFRSGSFHAVDKKQRHSGR